MSEISEFRDEMREALGQINQRLESMDKRMDTMKKENVENTQAICDLIYENDKKYCERFDRIEKRLDNVESICKEKWIAPDFQNRLEVIERVVTKHTEQINTLPCAQ